jgi:GT2 family glycosyltransferase
LDPLPVSVVIAAYNRPEMTRRAVRSALGQRPRPPAEVIVVDDCSGDDTGAAAAAAGARVIRHETNLGEGAARNTAIAAARQPWIGVLDSDDEWLPWLLQELWPLRGDHVLVAGSAIHLRPDGRPDRYAGLAGPRVRTLARPTALVYPDNIIPASGVLLRTEAVRARGGFDPGLKFCADLDLWLRLLETGTGVMSPRVVVQYHLHPGQVTHDRAAAATAYERVLRSHAGRPWWSETRMQAWRGAQAWDALRRREPRGRRAAVGFLLGHPARGAGLLGILLRRFWLRRRLARIQAASGTAVRPAAAS